MQVACIVILGAALAAVLMRLLLLKRELRRLGERLSAIADIDTNALLTTGSADRDIESLANAVNRMLERSRRVILHKERTEMNLKRAVTNISHDLRTPLTAALGYARILESGGVNAEMSLRYIGTVRERLETLSELMDGLFEYARVIEDGTAFNVRSINAGNVLRDTLSEFYSELDASGFIVDIDIPDVPELCRCDGGALRRILQNLLKNVCVHGREYLRVRLNKGEIEIANKIDGAEMPDITHMFERFYTADASRTSKNTGLGLAIVKELTERMGGSVTAEIDGELLIIRVKLPR